MKWVRIVAGTILGLALVSPLLERFISSEPLTGALFVVGILLEPIASIVHFAVEGEERSA